MPERIVPAVWLDAHQLEKVGDEPVPDDTLPFTAQVMARLAIKVPWVINHEVYADAPEPLSSTLLLQSTEEHRRSTEIDLLSIDQSRPSRLPNAVTRAIWQDEFGNPYGALGYKGNYGQSIEAFPGTTDPQGTRIYGLQTTYALERCLKASRLLREQGIETELISGAYIPKDLPHEHTLTPHTQLKAHLYMKAALESAVNETHPSDDHIAFTDEELAALHTTLTEAHFVVTARSMLVPERLADIVDSDAVTAKRMLQRAMRVATILRLGDERQLESYESFMGEVVATRLGAHIRKMHELGLAHRMLHPGNITLTGGIIDLDSVVGTAIGLNERDQQVTTNDALEDFHHYILDILGDNGTLDALFDNLQQKRLISDAKATYTTFMRTLYKTYMSASESDQATQHAGIVLSPDTLLPVIAQSFVRPSYGNYKVRSTKELESTLIKLVIDTAATRELDITAPDEQASLLAQCAEHLAQSGDLRHFIDTFGDIVPKATLLAAIRNGVIDPANQPEETTNGPLPRLVHLMTSVAEAYGSHIPASTKNVISPFAETTEHTVANHTYQLSAAMPLERAVQTVAALPIHTVHVTQRSYSTLTDVETWATKETIFGASVCTSNVDMPVLKEVITARYIQDISEQARQIRRNNQESRVFYLGRARKLSAYVPLAESPGESDYILHLSHTEDGLQLHIEMFGEPVDISSLFENTKLEHVPLIISED